MTLRTTVSQHLGDDPATGLRIVHTLEVRTEVGDHDPAAAADLHAAKVELAALDAGPRCLATEWIDLHAEAIAGCSPAQQADWIRRAIEETADPELIARIRDMSPEQLPPGAEDRAVERWWRERGR